MRYLHCKPAAFMLLGAMFIGGGCDQGADAPKADSGHSEENVFRDASLETGLIFHHVNGAAGEFYLPEIMGAGAALIDFDDDGDLAFSGPGNLLGWRQARRRGGVSAAHWGPATPLDGGGEGADCEREFLAREASRRSYPLQPYNCFR